MKRSLLRGNTLSHPELFTALAKLIALKNFAVAGKFVPCGGRD